MSRAKARVVPGVALLGALTLGLTGAPDVVLASVLAAALAALAWSFGRDVVWQLRAGARSSRR